MTSSTVIPDVQKKEWNQATEKAREAVTSAGEMAGHAAAAVGGMATQAACAAGNKVDQLVALAGHGIHSVGDSLERSLPGNGVMGAASKTLAGAVQSGGEYLEDQKLSGMARDFTGLIRRNPIPSVLISIGIGWFIARRIWK
jgi:hypothetical protein